MQAGKIKYLFKSVNVLCNNYRQISELWANEKLLFLIP